MDLHHQAEVKRITEEHGASSVLVLLGSPDPESAELSAETVVLGDPTFAGPLSEVQLGLDVYHVLEDEIRQAIPTAVWDEQIGVMADVLDAQAIGDAVRAMRARKPAAS